MPKRSTPFRYLAAGIYVRRLGDAIHVVTTGDSLPPDTERGEGQVAIKANWLTEQEVSIEQFGDIVNELAPESKGQLVNVGSDEEPFLLTQQQAARFGEQVEIAAEALVASRAETAAPVPA